MSEDGTIHADLEVWHSDHGWFVHRDQALLGSLTPEYSGARQERSVPTVLGMGNQE